MEGYTGWCFFPVRHLGDGGTDRREILHDGWYILVLNRSSPFLGAGTSGMDPEIRNFGHLIANISITVSRSTCQLELNISSTRAF